MIALFLASARNNTAGAGPVLQTDSIQPGASASRTATTAILASLPLPVAAFGPRFRPQTIQGRQPAGARRFVAAHDSGPRRHRRGPSDSAGAPSARRQPREDRAPRRIGEGGEGFRKRVHGYHLTYMLNEGQALFLCGARNGIQAPARNSARTKPTL